MRVSVTDKIIIRDLRLRAVIGVQERERNVRQDLRVNLILYTDMRSAGRADDLGSALDYSTVADDIVAYGESSAHCLLEALATAIAERCVRQHGVERVIVRVDKPGALRVARSVGVQIERSRADFA